jgi:hypothetical protein
MRHFLNALGNALEFIGDWFNGLAYRLYAYADPRPELTSEQFSEVFGQHIAEHRALAEKERGPSDA